MLYDRNSPIFSPMPLLWIQFDLKTNKSAKQQSNQNSDMIFVCLIKSRAPSNFRNSTFVYNLGAEFLREHHLFSSLLNKSEGHAINLQMTALLKASFLDLVLHISELMLTLLPRLKLQSPGLPHLGAAHASPGPSLLPHFSLSWLIVTEPFPGNGRQPRGEVVMVKALPPRYYTINTFSDWLRD